MLVSPTLLITLGYGTARLFTPFLGTWAWVPLFLVYWAAMTAVILAIGGLPGILAAYRRPSGWPLWLAGLFVGLLPMPLLILHRNLLHAPLLVACWLGIALVNPWIEEIYWRSLLGEATQRPRFRMPW